MRPFRFIHACPVWALCTAALLLGALARPAGAQDAERPPAFVAVKADTVVLHLTEAPSLYSGFVVYRAEAGGEAERITPAPVRPVRRPSAARVLIGDDWDAVMRAVRATDAVEVLRRLRSDAFAGNVLSGLYPGVGRVLGRRYTDPGRAPGSELEYRIVYTDADGQETDRSFTVSVRVEERAPAPPTGLEVEAGDGAAVVSWTYPAFSGDARDVVVGFHVERAEGTGAFQRLTDTPALRSTGGGMRFRDDGLENGVAYRYRVRAVDLVGRESAPGDPVAVTPRDETPPAPPKDLTAQPGDGEVLLVWPVSPEPDVAGYHVERSTGRGSEYRRLSEAPVPALEPLWRDTTARGGVQYFYRVIAVDRSGNASRPSNPRAVVPDDDTPPAPPPGVEAEVAERRVRLRWQPSPSPDVRGYYIARGTARDRLVRITHEPVAGTEFVDTGYVGDGLNPGDRYLVSIAAVDHADNVSDSVTVAVRIPDDEPPAAPAQVTAENVGGRYARIAWQASPSVDVAEYRLTRIAAVGAGSSASAVLELGRFPARGVRSVRDSSVVHGSRYVYALVAVDSAGNTSEAAVDTLLHRRPTPPPPPRHAAARATDAGVVVTWERVVDPELVGYHVYRSTLPTGVYERITDEPLTERRFVDASGGPEFFYVVRAVDRSGNESDASPAVSAGGR